MRVEQRKVKYEVYSDDCFFKTFENIFDNSINLDNNKEENLHMAVAVSDINTNSGIASREISDFIANFDKEGKVVEEMINGVVELL